MSDIVDSRRALLARVLEGEGTAPRDQRRAAFDNASLAEPMRTLVEKVANHAYKVTDEDVAAAKRAGLSEDQIFELVVSAAVGQATRLQDRAVAALDAATPKE